MSQIRETVSLRDILTYWNGDMIKHKSIELIYFNFKSIYIFYPAVFKINCCWLYVCWEGGNKCEPQSTNPAFQTIILIYILNCLSAMLVTDSSPLKSSEKINWMIFFITPFGKATEIIMRSNLLKIIQLIWAKR